MESGILKKRKEKDIIVGICRDYFTEGKIVNNGNILNREMKNFTIGKNPVVKRGVYNSIIIVFIQKDANILHNMTIWMDGKQAEIIG